MDEEEQPCCSSSIPPAKEEKHPDVSENVHERERSSNPSHEDWVGFMMHYAQINASNGYLVL